MKIYKSENKYWMANGEKISPAGHIEMLRSYSENKVRGSIENQTVCLEAARWLQVWMLENTGALLQRLEEGFRNESARNMLSHVHWSFGLVSYLIKSPNANIWDATPLSLSEIPAYIAAAEYLETVSKIYESETDRKKPWDVEDTASWKREYWNRSRIVSDISHRLRENPESKPEEPILNFNYFSPSGVWAVSTGYVFPISIYVKVRDSPRDPPRYFYNLNRDPHFGSVYSAADIRFDNPPKGLDKFGRN